MNEPENGSEDNAIRLENLLNEARDESEYYRQIAVESGRRHLRELINVSGLVKKLKEAEKELKKAYNLMEKKVEERTTEISLINQELEKKNSNLGELNTALKVLLNKRDEDKAEFEEKIYLNLKGLVEPYLDKLKTSRLDEEQKTYLSILEANIKDITSPFMLRVSSKNLNFTPMEFRVADLIKQGHSSKEIASLLNLSPRTIESHRENIRKKMGINKTKANLRTHLLSIK